MSKKKCSICNTMKSWENWILFQRVFLKDLEPVAS